MRIAYVHQYFTTPERGGGTRSYEFARRWVQAGHEVHMITASSHGPDSTGGWEHYDVEGISVHAASVPYANKMSIDQRLRAFAQFALMASRGVRRVHSDVVYATSTPLTVAIPAKLGTVGRRTPYVFEVRDQWPDVPIAMGYLRNPALRLAAQRLEMTAYRGAGHVVALAPGMKQDIVAKGIPPEKVSVIPQGCDRYVFQEAEHLDLTRYPWSSSPYLFTYAGAIGEANGLEYVLDLAQALGSMRHHAVIAVIGEGKHRKTLEAEAARRGILGKHVHFLGPLTKPDVGRWFAASAGTLAVLTGPPAVWKDAVQNKFMDSLAAERPIACNHNGWQTQVAVAEGVGCFLDPGDAAKGAATLLDMIEDDAWMARVPANCRRLAETAFNRDRQAAEALAILERLVNV